MIRQAEKAFPDDYYLMHFRGRLFYEFIYFVVIEMQGRLLHQKKLLDAATNSLEKVSYLQQVIFDK